MIVAGLMRTGVIPHLSAALMAHAASSPTATRWAAGAIVAVACNLINNLPAGLIVHSVASSAPDSLTSALLIGVDLGPNLSVTGAQQKAVNRRQKFLAREESSIISTDINNCRSQ